MMASGTAGIAITKRVITAPFIDRNYGPNYCCKSRTDTYNLVVSVMALHFNILSRFIIGFLSSCRCLFISRLHHAERCGG